MHDLIFMAFDTAFVKVNYSELFQRERFNLFIRLFSFILAVVSIFRLFAYFTYFNFNYFLLLFCYNFIQSSFIKPMEIIKILFTIAKARLSDVINCIFLEQMLL